MRKITILLLLIVNLSAYSTDLNYHHKQIQKQLSKLWTVELSSLIELSEITKNIISEGKIFKVETSNSILGYIYIGRVISCRTGGCSKERTNPISGNYEYFDMFIIYNHQKSIELVKVFNYQATHGQEICSRGWLKQFINNENDKYFEVGKSIDGISGATISTYALTNEVNYITRLLINSTNR